MRHFIAILLLTSASLVAQQQKGTTQPDWTAVVQALGRPGTPQEGGGMKFGFPRSDLKVRIGETEVKPALALGTWFAFSSPGKTAHVMGDMVLTEDEQEQVVRSLAKANIEISAIHNHLLRETPKIIYVHISAVGDAQTIAKGLNAALSLTKTPPAHPATDQPIDLNVEAIEQELGAKGRATGGVLQFSFPRGHDIQHDTFKIPAWMGTATAINFQPLGGGKAAITGDFVLTSDEVNPIIHILVAGGINVTALHHHMLDERPRMFFMHFWATGDALELAKSLRQVLRRSKHK
jgi:hypothetical protein